MLWARTRWRLIATAGQISRLVRVGSGSGAGRAGRSCAPYVSLCLRFRGRRRSEAVKQPPAARHNWRGGATYHAARLAICLGQSRRRWQLVAAAAGVLADRTCARSRLGQTTSTGTRCHQLIGALEQAITTAGRRRRLWRLDWCELNAWLTLQVLGHQLTSGHGLRLRQQRISGGWWLVWDQVIGVVWWCGGRRGGSGAGTQYRRLRRARAGGGARLVAYGLVVIAGCGIRGGFVATAGGVVVLLGVQNAAAAAGAAVFRDVQIVAGFGERFVRFIEVDAFAGCCAAVALCMTSGRC